MGRAERKQNEETRTYPLRVPLSLAGSFLIKRHMAEERQSRRQTEQLETHPSTDGPLKA